jgi:Secretion system C-terminal sorting domain
MKKYLLMILFVMLHSVSDAQSSAIFFGGIGDGLSTQSNAQTYIDFRKGSVGDGATNTNYKQAYTDVRKGAAGDGWINSNYTQGYTDVRKGAAGDGWMTTNYAQTYTDVRTGGLGDGWTAQLAILPLRPLGIEFLSFTGQQKAGADVLDWQTLNEKNVAHFVIEHGANSFSFNKMAQVKAAGNTNGIIDYAYTNANPDNGNNFYRLKMVDEDGTFIYSNVILLKTTMSKSVISVYPNPAATVLNINVASITKLAAQIHVFDVQGKIVYQQKLDAGNGATSIDVQAWASGNYIIKITQGTEVNTIKVVKP